MATQRPLLPASLSPEAEQLLISPVARSLGDPSRVFTRPHRSSSALDNSGRSGYQRAFVGKTVDPFDLVARISLAVDRLGHSGGCLLNCPTSPESRVWA
jgi:hypothetical protein